MKFAKGTSGNPGGRPKGNANLKAWVLEKFETPAGREVLWGRAMTSDLILKFLLETGYGKPAQELTGPGGGPLQVAHLNDWRHD